MQNALIKYDKYLIIQSQNVTADQKVVEPICFKFKVTMHDDDGHPYEYQFTNGEIISLLKGETVVKHTNNHLVDFDFCRLLNMKIKSAQLLANWLPNSIGMIQKQKQNVMLIYATRCTIKQAAFLATK